MYLLISDTYIRYLQCNVGGETSVQCCYIILHFTYSLQELVEYWLLRMVIRVQEAGIIERVNGLENHYFKLK